MVYTVKVALDVRIVYPDVALFHHVNDTPKSIERTFPGSETDRGRVELRLIQRLEYIDHCLLYHFIPDRWKAERTLLTASFRDISPEYWQWFIGLGCEVSQKFLEISLQVAFEGKQTDSVYSASPSIRLHF